jgi:hypothetical protein
MSDTPSTQVIRHWVAWGVTADCPDEHSDHSVERVQQFEAWFESELQTERDRIIKLLEKLKEPDMKFYKFQTLVNIDRIIAVIKGEDK